MINAIFDDPENTKTTVSDEVWQYDYGQTLSIQGLSLPTVVEVDFSYDPKGDAQSVITAGVTLNGTTEVAIPDSMFDPKKTKDYEVYAYVFEGDGDSGETTYMITIPVMTRPMRDEYNDTDPDVFGYVLDEINGAADTASQAASAAMTAMDVITAAVGNFVGVSISKENGVTTLTIIDGNGVTSTATIEDGKFVGHTYDSSTKTLTLFEED